MRTRMNDVIGALIDQTVNSASPREGFAAELLTALREVPVFPVMGDSNESGTHLRWILPGAVVGTVGAAGALWYGINRWSRRPS